MTKLLTPEEKIDKILEYCDYVKDLARSSNCAVHFIVEIENTLGETETEQETPESEYTECTVDTSFLHILINNAVKKAYYIILY